MDWKVEAVLRIDQMRTAQRLAMVNRAAVKRFADHMETVNTEAVKKMNTVARKLARERGQAWL